MSTTALDRVGPLLEWLDNNAYLSEGVRLDISPATSGIGVFYDPEAEHEDNLIFRIPKTNILSPKTAFVWPLLYEFSENHSENAEVDLAVGLHALVMSFIYELSLGEDSPWDAYICSIVPSDDDKDQSNVPICLWLEAEKKALFNSECDLLGMLQTADLVDFFVEAVRFARLNEGVVTIPDVLAVEGDIEELEEKAVLEAHRKKVIQFGKYMQAVLLRAFSVDEFHGLSLIPGADIFNHLVPKLNEKGSLEGVENVHFVCDGGEDICGECGEPDCENHEEDSEDDMDVFLDENGELIDEGDIQDEREIAGDESEIVGDESELIGDESGLLAEDSLLAASDGDEELEGSDEEDEEEEGEEEEEEEELSEGDEGALPEISEITMDYIAKMEEELEREELSDAETLLDDEEVSTLSLSEEENEEDEHDDEKEGDEELALDLISAQEDLAMDLADSTKCCDIVLVRPPTQETQFELFNTYGNGLANAYLLQRYGFVSKNNVNNSYLLLVQLFQYLKTYEGKHSTLKARQLERKLNWYEEGGFDLVNDLVCEYEGGQNEGCGAGCEEGCEKGENGCEKDDNTECEKECQDGCNDEKCGEGSENDHNEAIAENVPETWQLSPRISADGIPTAQTYALVNLLLMPYKEFYYKLAQNFTEQKLVRRVVKHLLPYAGTTDAADALILEWCKHRLARYKDINLSQADSGRAEIIAEMTRQEKEALASAVAQLSD